MSGIQCTNVYRVEADSLLGKAGETTTTSLQSGNDFGRGGLMRKGIDQRGPVIEGAQC